MMREFDIGESALLTDLAMCVNYYRLFSPGLFCCTHIGVQLEGGIKLRPDIVVMVNSGKYKQCDPGSYDDFIGPPNFVLDVFPEEDWLDYEYRRDCYEKAGVQEYVAISCAMDWRWNRLVDGNFVVVETTDDETIYSSALPGLWVPALALKERDWWSIMSSTARGVTREDHHEFMHAIWRPEDNGA